MNVLQKRMNLFTVLLFVIVAVTFIKRLWDTLQFTSGLFLAWNVQVIYIILELIPIMILIGALTGLQLKKQWGWWMLSGSLAGEIFIRLLTTTNAFLISVDLQYILSNSIFLLISLIILIVVVIFYRKHNLQLQDQAAAKKKLIRFILFSLITSVLYLFIYMGLGQAKMQLIETYAFNRN